MPMTISLPFAASTTFSVSLRSTSQVHPGGSGGISANGTKSSLSIPPFGRRRSLVRACGQSQAQWHLLGLRAPHSQIVSAAGSPVRLAMIFWRSLPSTADAVTASIWNLCPICFLARLT